jgi:ribosomal protein S18 acetylase RimI-like enzyme
VETGVEIRVVQPSEHDELRRVRLSALAYTPELAEHLAREAAAEPSFWCTRAAEAAAATKRVTFVAVRDASFVGVADGALADDGQAVEIGGMWVDQTIRRHGVGKRLLLAVCDWGRARGATTAMLWVRDANTPARHLYERAGFRVVRSSAGSIAGFQLEATL